MPAGAIIVSDVLDDVDVKLEMSFFCWIEGGGPLHLNCSVFQRYIML